MKVNISSRSQLKLEIERVTQEKLRQEQQINQHLRDYAQSLKPINMIKNAFSSVNKDQDLKGMFKKKGIEAAVALMVTQLLFKNSNPIIRTAATLFGTSFATGVFGDDASKYITKIKNLFQKFKRKSDQRDNEFFNEEDIYTG